MKVKEYSPENKHSWNEFLRDSLNGTFLFHRDFMDYHSDQSDVFESMFVDNSLIFYGDDEIKGVLPANASGTTLETHRGLTYGGFIFDNPSVVDKLFDCLIDYLRDGEFNEVLYKDIPFIYYPSPNQRPSHEIYRHGGTVHSKHLSSVIDLRSTTNFRRDRRRGIETAKDHELNVRKTDKWDVFWDILRTVLDARHDTEPTHSVEEISYLKQNFPDNIHLFGTFEGEELVAGIVVFETECVAHSQYNANTLHGRDIGANDLLHAHLIRGDHFSDKKYFDFGRSTENSGLKLNDGLYDYKNSFGASPITYDQYRIPTK